MISFSFYVNAFFIIISVRSVLLKSILQTLIAFNKSLTRPLIVNLNQLSSRLIYIGMKPIFTIIQSFYTRLLFCMLA